MHVRNPILIGEADVSGRMHCKQQHFRASSICWWRAAALLKKRLFLEMLVFAARLEVLRGVFFQIKGSAGSHRKVRLNVVYLRHLGLHGSGKGCARETFGSWALAQGRGGGGGEGRGKGKGGGKVLFIFRAIVFEDLMNAKPHPKFRTKPPHPKESCTP